MVSTVISAALKGLCVDFVQVEADVSNGLPILHMVGYLSSEVKEAGDRVRSAIRNAGMVLPSKKIVINLSPADVRKHGTAFDLPIAVAILTSLELIPETDLKRTVFIGELGLDGTVKRVPGILPIVSEAKNQGYRICIIPEENRAEGELTEGMQIIGVTHLKEVCEVLSGILPKKRKKGAAPQKKVPTPRLDYSDVHGQAVLKRAVEVAVAGGHNLLMVGPPGVGKTMIAKRIPTILPPLTKEESLELTRLYSVAGVLEDRSPLMTERPFREVHHSVTKSALLGGGRIPHPGEISLAQHGVLFLDELAEFPKALLELLRQPMETHKINIIRQNQECEFPAGFLLVAAMNPCPCGNYPDLNRCTCTTPQIQAYRHKVSQPFLDRIDICVEAEKIPYQKLKEQEREETSAQIRKRVERAREIQKQRFRTSGFRVNTQMGVEEIHRHCGLKKREEALMEQAYQKLNLTARTYHKILCVARTIADLDGKEQIEEMHLCEAIGYRMPDKKYWGVS